MSETLAEHNTTMDTLRQRVRDYMTVNNRSAAAASRELDVPPSTLSAWLAETYQGNNDTVAAKVERGLRALEERAATAAQLPDVPGYIATPSATTFAHAFRHTQLAPDFAVISGAPGVGKTTAVREYQRATPHVYVLTAEPVIASGPAMLEALAEEIGIADRLGARRLSRQIRLKLGAARSLLVVDEAQHLSTPALDQLRSVHDMANVGIALVGNEDLYTRLEGAGRSKQFAQLHSRVGYRVPRPKPVKGDIAQLLDAWRIEGAAERKMLTTIAGKPGALRLMTKVLRQARMAASLDGQAAIAVGHVRDAYASLLATDLNEEG